MKKLIVLLSIFSLISKNDKHTTGYCDIKGEVKNPGVYEIKENNTIQDIIKLAGGLKKSSYTDNINLSKKVTDEMVIYIFSKSEINGISKLNNCECVPIYKYTGCEEENKNSMLETTNKITTTKNTTTNKVTNENNYNTTTTNISSNSIVTQPTVPIITRTTTKPSTTSTTTLITTQANNKININNCTLEQLIELNGLGESKAKKIIEYREKNKFLTIEDILKVDGIGNATFEKIKDFIEV